MREVQSVIKDLLFLDIVYKKMRVPAWRIVKEIQFLKKSLKNCNLFLYPQTQHVSASSVKNKCVYYEGIDTPASSVQLSEWLR